MDNNESSEYITEMYPYRMRADIRYIYFSCTVRT